MFLTCRTCSRSGDAEFVDRVDYGKSRIFETFIFRDGTTIRNGFCRECQTKKSRERRGKKTRDETSSPFVLKALRAEITAEKRFLALGFFVERTKMHGPDLTCKMNSLSYTVEVKKANQLWHKCGRSGGWRVGPVTPKRRGDDLVAMVLPNGYVYIDSMENHLRNCSNSGARAISKIVNEFGKS